MSKRKRIPETTVTLDMMKLSADTGNVYETTMIIAKRANQIAVDMKRELQDKLKDFSASPGDEPLEEVFENREQIEVSKFYERMPKPTLVAIREYEEGKVFHKNPVKDKSLF
jgi:DNA-directed RNA polymerase subunit K/omega